MTRVIPADSLAVCKKCNSTDVTWAKSRKSNKFYLTEVFMDADDELITDRTDFHSGYCGDRAKHDAKQASITKDDGGDEIARAMELRMDATAIENSNYYLRLHDLCKNDPSKAKLHVAALMSERDEAEDDSALRSRIVAEISFCKAALGMS